MGNVRKFHSLQQLHSGLLPFSALRARSGTCTRYYGIRRLAPGIACSLLLLAGIPALAQCPAPSVHQPLPAGSQTTVQDPTAIPLHQDLRSSVVAHKHYKCQDDPPSRRLLSKEDLLELRRAVREHARNNPLHNAP